MLDLHDTIEAKSREAGNKSLARRLRRLGGLPAVAYGPAGKPRYLALDPKRFVQQRLKFGLSHIYNVEVAGAPGFKALIKAVQQDPITRTPLHVDLYALDMNQPIRVVVPIELEGKPMGLLEGGLLSQVLRSTEVQCLPHLIPSKLVGDVTPLAVGQSLHLSDLPLPEGVRLTAHGDEAIAQVVEPESAPAADTAAASAPAAATPAAKAGDSKK